jgi:hypothetical protein
VNKVPPWIHITDAPKWELLTRANSFSDRLPNIKLLESKILLPHLAFDQVTDHLQVFHNSSPTTLEKHPAS